jgi:hypothetical protein
MEKLFAALVPVLCVMALGPLCCQAAEKFAVSKMSAPTPGAGQPATERKSSF